MMDAVNLDQQEGKGCEHGIRKDLPDNSVSVHSHKDSVTSSLITTLNRRLMVQTVRKTVWLDGVETSGWYELKVSASPNADENIAPFRVVGGCEEILEEMVSLKNWLNRYGVDEVDEVYWKICHMI